MTTYAKRKIRAQKKRIAKLEQGLNEIRSGAYKRFSRDGEYWINAQWVFSIASGTLYS